DSRILYVTESQAFNYQYQKVFQYDLLQPNPGLSEQLVATIQDFPVLESSLQLGPDNRIYVALRLKSFLAVINYPDQFNSAFSPNACGFNYNGPSLKNTLNQGGQNEIGLPNMIDAKPGTLPADFYYLVANCLTVQFHAVNCSGPYNWNFGDS